MDSRALLDLIQHDHGVFRFPYGAGAVGPVVLHLVAAHDFFEFTEDTA